MLTSVFLVTEIYVLLVAETIVLLITKNSALLFTDYKRSIATHKPSHFNAVITAAFSGQVNRPGLTYGNKVCDILADGRYLADPVRRTGQMAVLT